LYEDDLETKMTEVISENDLIIVMENIYSHTAICLEVKYTASAS